MNTKTPERQREKNNVKRVSDAAKIPGRAYFLVLMVTVLLLVSCLIAFFVFLGKDAPDGNFYDQGYNGSVNVKPNGSGSSNQGSMSQGSSNNSSQGVDKSSTSRGGNLPGKTVSKRSSYISKTASDVKYISSQINSENVILIDLDTYTSIAEKSADKRIYPASMTKVMSLLVACENVKSLSTVLTVTEDVVEYASEMDGSGIGLKVGDRLTIQDLLYLTAYQSDTIAVTMLANYVGGSETGFVNLMNSKARTLGLTNTRFANPTGLHDENNYTTCREMAAIFAYALENPLCKELLTSYSAYKIGNQYTIYSTWYSGRFKDNPKLSTVTVSGGKTGDIDESGFCLVSYATGRSSGKKFIQVIVGQPKGSGLTESISVSEIKYVYNNFAS